MIRSYLALIGIALFALPLSAQPLANHKHTDSSDPFYQIDQWLPTPNEQRTASGAPGLGYWQQRAESEIDVTLDDQNQRLSGIARIHYTNQSPHSWRYI